ncbi:hypothetical protein TNCV_2611871 [Trichonephila clavipes]|nr:hypothetical protein TNCV_2611871 [Trichonephila clavipes]
MVKRVVVSNATCLTKSDRGPRNSSWQGARSMLVVGLEHHTATIVTISYASTTFIGKQSKNVDALGGVAKILEFRHSRIKIAFISLARRIGMEIGNYDFADSAISQVPMVVPSSDGYR